MITTFLIAGASLLSNCSAVQDNEKQFNIHEERTVSHFTKIESSGPFDIVLEKGSKEHVKIDVSGIEDNKIITEVKGSTLEVYTKDGNYKNIKGKITITFVDLFEIANSGSGNLSCVSDISSATFSINSKGSGDIEMAGKMKTTDFDFQLKGSGNVTFANLEAKNFHLSILGSGNFKAASGSIQQQTIHLSGSGNVELFGVTAETCSVSLKGSGNVETTVSTSLQGSILGSGNITYKGNPATHEIKVAGSGNLLKG